MRKNLLVPVCCVGVLAWLVWTNFGGQQSRDSSMTIAAVEAPPKVNVADDPDVSGLTQVDEPRVEAETPSQPALAPAKADAVKDVNQSIREFRLKSLDALLQRFTGTPDKPTAQVVLSETMATILDATGSYQVVPSEGVVQSSTTDPRLPADSEYKVQLIGDFQNRKYVISKAQFPLVWEIKRCLPEIVTGKPELSPEQIQAVKDQIEIARQLVK